MRPIQKRQEWEKYDSIIFGIGVGVLVPFVGLAILMMLNEQIAALDIETANGLFDGLSDRLLRLLAICLNLIPFNLFKRRRMDASMRGSFFPTFAYAMWWMSVYIG